MTEHRYGQKGGDSPTAGKRASVYQAVLPDGSTITKRSFTVHSEDARLHIYRIPRRNPNRWYLGGIYSLDDGPHEFAGEPVFVPAVRII